MVRRWQPARLTASPGTLIRPAAAVRRHQNKAANRVVRLGRPREGKGNPRVRLWENRTEKRPTKTQADARAQRAGASGTDKRLGAGRGVRGRPLPKPVAQRERPRAHRVRAAPPDLASCPVPVHRAGSRLPRLLGHRLPLCAPLLRLPGEDPRAAVGSQAPSSPAWRPFRSCAPGGLRPRWREERAAGWGGRGLRSPASQRFGEKPSACSLG